MVVPPRDWSSVAVRVFDDNVRWNGDPFFFGLLEARPVDAVTNIFFLVYSIGFIATQTARFW